MNERDSVRLRHMLDAAHSALSFAQGRTRDDLDQDEMLVFALTKAVEIVGEAANQVSSATRDELSTIPWPDVVGMRNRLVHVYFDIDLDVLWQTVAEDLPMLIDLVEPLVPHIEST
ncbi:MAG: DUF86 domain-containing protein [Dehalococcoidia bacterium]|nr:DUF86 domain-containing protein [Dehalococcoidia bacterium]